MNGLVESYGLMRFNNQFLLEKLPKCVVFFVAPKTLSNPNQVDFLKALSLENPLSPQH